MSRSELASCRALLTMLTRSAPAQRHGDTKKIKMKSRANLA
jgi:hypothetical protein